MDILLQILRDVATAGQGITGTYTIGGLVVTALRQRTEKKKTAELRAMLQQLGRVTPAAIGELVKQLVEGGVVVPAGPDGPARKLKCPKDMSQRLADVMLNLARGARVLISRGTPRGTLVEYRSLIEELLRTLDPIRKAGEPVAAGNEDWVLARFLGMGSVGEVWLGIFRPKKEGAPPPLNRQMLRAFKFFTHDGARQAMLSELHALTSALTALGTDPHIVQFYSAAVYDQKYPFLALEYVPGGSLEDWIVERADQRVPLKKHEIIRGVVSALARAHEYGICHRNLKPGNILLSEKLDPENGRKVYDVQAKISDFGFSLIKSAEESRPGFGDEGVVQSERRKPVSGTSMYLPPEADQPFFERKDAQDDVFALGVTWYQLLVERLERPPYDFADRLRDLGQDSRIIHLISRCLANPANRFADATELENEMGGVDVLPDWETAPPGFYNVSHLVREYVATIA